MKMNIEEHRKILLAIKSKKLSVAEFQKAIKNGFNYEKNIWMDDGDGNALYVCCERGNLKILKEIIKLNPNLNAEFLGTEYTPLILAANCFSVNAGKKIEILIKAGAIVDYKNIHKDTALIYAVCDNNIEAAVALLKHGADINQREASGNQSPLELAMEFRLIEMFELLLKHKPEINPEKMNESIAAGGNSWGGAKEDKKIIIKKMADYLEKEKKIDILEKIINSNIYKESMGQDNSLFAYCEKKLMEFNKIKSTKNKKFKI